MAAAVSAHTPSRPHARPIGVVLSVIAGVAGASCVGAAAAAANAADQRVAVASEPATGSWQSHRYQFQYLSSNTTYSCVGLADKLRLLLRTTGARDVQSNPVCFGHPGVPERVPEATLRFQSLVPASAGGNASSRAGMTAPGVWRHVTWSPGTPTTLGSGDCSLIEELLEKVLPMLATRNLQTKFDCAQYHDYGSFSVSFDVFAPADNR
jgi:hypothetical protein